MLKRHHLAHLKILLSADLIAPLILISLYLGLLIFLKGSLPSTEEVLEHAQSLYARYGYEVIFLGALLEALVLINLFVPGSLAVGFGAVFARSGHIDLPLAVIAAFLGAMLGFIIDFCLGYFGFGGILKKISHGHVVKQAKSQIAQSSIRTFSLGFIHPNIGSVISLAAGTLKMNPASFLGLSAISTFVWFSFWAIIFFLLGEVFLVILTKYFFLLVLLLLGVWVGSILYGKSKGKNQKSKIQVKN